MTALRYVCENKKDIPKLKLLLENGANPNLQCKDGYTALMDAVLADCADAVKILLDYGADPTIKNQARETAHDLAKQHDASCIDLLK